MLNYLPVYMYSCYLFLVWKYLLWQFSPTSFIFLSTIPRESFTVQTASEKQQERDFVDMSSRLVLQYCYPEEKSRDYCSKEVYYKIEERIWYVYYNFQTKPEILKICSEPVYVFFFPGFYLKWWKQDIGILFPAAATLRMIHLQQTKVLIKIFTCYLTKATVHRKICHFTKTHYCDSG